MGWNIKIATHWYLYYLETKWSYAPVDLETVTTLGTLPKRIHADKGRHRGSLHPVPRLSIERKVLFWSWRCLATFVRTSPGRSVRCLRQESQQEPSLHGRHWSEHDVVRLLLRKFLYTHDGLCNQQICYKTACRKVYDVFFYLFSLPKPRGILLCCHLVLDIFSWV